MLLPFLGWAVTGFVFFLKPGYAGAYDTLQPRTYPLDGEVSLKPDPAWLEIRYVRTVLGEHLLARTAGGWEHLDPRTRLPKPAPGAEEVRMLVADAIAANPDRYGQVASVAGNQAVTDRGVKIALNWERLALSQRGKDSERIDLLYRVHYLQWTGIAAVDKALGLTGLILVLALSGLGVRLFFASGGAKS